MIIIFRAARAARMRAFSTRASALHRIVLHLYKGILANVEPLSILLYSKLPWRLLFLWVWLNDVSSLAWCRLTFGPWTAMLTRAWANTRPTYRAWLNVSLDVNVGPGQAPVSVLWQWDVGHKHWGRFCEQHTEMDCPAGRSRLLTQCWLNPGPTSETLDQDWAGTGCLGIPVRAMPHRDVLTPASSYSRESQSQRKRSANMDAQLEWRFYMTDTAEQAWLK